MKMTELARMIAHYNRVGSAAINYHITNSPIDTPDYLTYILGEDQRELYYLYFSFVTSTGATLPVLIKELRDQEAPRIDLAIDVCSLAELYQHLDQLSQRNLPKEITHFRITQEDQVTIFSVRFPLLDEELPA